TAKEALPCRPDCCGESVRSFPRLRLRYPATEVPWQPSPETIPNHTLCRPEPSEAHPRSDTASPPHRWMFVSYPAIQRSIRLRSHVFEKWRTFDICRTRIPLEELARGSIDHLPSLVAFKRFFVGLAEHLGPNRRIDRLHDFFLRRPDIAQIDWLSAFVAAERLCFQVDVHLTRERICHHERRPGQII